MNEKRKLHHVEDRLIVLQSIKDIDGLIDQQKIWKMNNKAKRVLERHPEKSDYMTNVGFTVKSAKDAELLSGIQEYSFIPMDEDARANIPVVKLNWKYWWLTSKTDRMLSKVIPEATAFWTGIMYEALKTIRQKVREPIRAADGTITYKDKVVTTYDGVWTEYIPWENFFFDGDDIAESNECIWVKYWDRANFLKENEFNPNYSNLNKIPLGKQYTNVTTSDDGKFDQDNDSVITEIRYYNKSEDSVIILANGVEVSNGSIPYTHKELPFCLFYDYEVIGRGWGMGEYELLWEDIEYRDALRSLSIDVIKAQMWTTLINEGNDIDTSTFEMGTSTYTTVDDVNGIKWYGPNISTSSIDNAEAKVDNDIISKSGIDFKAQQFSSETATRTDAKTASARKKINLALKINGYSFFERLARLRMANIQLLHTNKREIFTEGVDVDSKGVTTAINWWYGSMVVEPKMLKGKFNLIPITESILGDSEARDLEHMLRFAEVAGNIVEDGKPVIQPAKLTEEITTRFGYDFEKLTSASEQQKSPEAIVNDLEAENRGTSLSPTDPNSADFIPPEQRSGATNIVPTSWGRASL